MTENWQALGAAVESWFKAGRYGSFELNCAHIQGEFCWTCRFGSHPQGTGGSLAGAVQAAALAAGADPDTLSRLMGGS